jgi:hypothetical protein
LIELTHGRIAHPYWAIVSALLGLHYRQIVGPSVGNRGPLTFDDDFVVPLDELEGALADLPTRNG